MTRRIIVFAPNWLGDAVMALPAIQAVREDVSVASLDVAARPAVAPLFDLVQGIGKVLTLGGRAESAAALRDGRYDAALLLPNSFNTARLARQAGIGERWGYRADFRSFLLTRSVAPQAGVHQIEHYRHLTRALGFEGEASAPTLHLGAACRDRGAATLKAEGWDQTRPLVAVAPGAAFGGAKRWPAASFAQLVDDFAADHVHTVLIGSGGDRAAGRELVAASRGSARPIDLIGRTDLSLLAGVLAHCRVLVTNDSGAMHFAAALGVNIAAMFGPTRDRETHPRGAGRYAVLTHQVWCRPCMLRECPLTHACMAGISVESVAVAARSLL